MIEVYKSVVPIYGLWNINKGKYNGECATFVFRRKTYNIFGYPKYNYEIKQSYTDVRRSGFRTDGEYTSADNVDFVIAYEKQKAEIVIYRQRERDSLRLPNIIKRAKRIKKYKK